MIVLIKILNFLSKDENIHIKKVKKVISTTKEDIDDDKNFNSCIYILNDIFYGVTRIFICSVLLCDERSLISVISKFFCWHSKSIFVS